VLGPTHHGIFKSIYFFDPNGHRVELAADARHGAADGRLRPPGGRLLTDGTRHHG